MTTKIKPQEYYSMQKIVQGKLFPWAKTYPTVRKFVEHDQQTGNFLKAIISGEGNAKKYRFKGENIIKFINAVESGKVRL
jgi:menaquinone-dependent protoporphyrinogen IX oxidase